MTSGVLPFFALSILNIMIYRGLQKVQRNLSRHQRLLASAATNANNTAKETGEEPINA